MLKAIGHSPFVLLVRSFFAQFFSSETVTSEIQLRQTIIWVLAFLLMPSLFLVFEVLPAYHFTVARDPAMAARLVIMLGSVFVTYTMVIVGFVAVFVWDSLTFDRRDAMVLGPLPMRSATIITAKLVALAAFLLGMTTIVNLVTAVPFALSVGDHLGMDGVFRHFAASMTATLLAAAFSFSAIVTLRGCATLIGGARLAAVFGSTLQFLFLTALLCITIVVPAVSPAKMKLLDRGMTGWIPPAWFFGVFEQLLGSTHAEYMVLAQRAFVATTIAVVAAVLVSVAGFRRQVQLALTPSAFTGELGKARFQRLVAGWLTGSRVARATCDFILITLARNRAQQAPIAINGAIGLAIVVAALVRYGTDLESLMRPRTAVLWIPLVLAYWITVGLRASFFVPSELAAAWSFRVNAPHSGLLYWSAVRSSMLAFIVPPTLVLSVALLVPLVGWRIAAWHTVIVCALITLLVQIFSMTVTFVPFTRAYVPGHAKLRSRWPIYLVGMYGIAYWPVQLELRILNNPHAMVGMAVGLALLIAVLEVAARRMVQNWRALPQEESDELFPDVTLLNLGGTIRNAPAHQ
jgi:hypothetical protein